ncbi:MAG: protamine-2 (modular protein), partial [Mesorhizobium sp.]
MFGIAGAAALVSAVRPINAVAGVPGARSGILDELDALETEPFEDEDTQPEPVRHRSWHRRRRRRRRAWRRACRRAWR